VAEWPIQVIVSLKASLGARRSVSVRAPAKINLTLRVLGTRSDGYHELRTTFQALSLHDRLTFTASPDLPFAIESDDPGCPLDRRNLVWRAAELLWDAAGRSGEPAEVVVRIAKRIPSQAGLGGASSDAAAALAGLAALWRVQLPVDRRLALAERLGSDVAFFTEGGRALGAGRGELLFPLPDGPRRPVVLAVPGFGVSTVEAYRWWDAWTRKSDAALGGGGLRAEAAPVLDLPPHARERWEKVLGCRLPASELVNDLQAPVAARHPEIARLTEVLRTAGALVSAMSGSGSVVFGIFDTRVRAGRAARVLAAAGVTAIVTDMLGRLAYARLARTIVRRE
jgi:4-diphosphocytidyl-2-C-methyl-D-erythritol kinase